MALYQQGMSRSTVRNFVYAGAFSERASVLRTKSLLDPYIPYNDYEAVKNSLLLLYSNGSVEGQINRLKFVKRSMYGRGSFQLLRSRFLEAA